MTIWLVIAALLAINMAWSMGANDVANAMGTAIGSRVLTLGQALAIAGSLEFAGAVLLSQRVVRRLATSITNTEQFAAQPQTLLLGMIAVLLASGLWLQLATRWGLPVSSTHAIVGAIAGFSLVAVGPSSLNWPALGQLALAWVLTPVFGGLLAAAVYGALRQGILRQADPWRYWQESCPWLAVLVIGVFGAGIAPQLGELKTGLSIALPSQTLLLLVGFVGVIVLTVLGLRPVAPELAVPESAPPSLEIQLGRFQIVSSSFVAFAHGANDVGNAIAPFAVVVAIVGSGAVPTTDLPVPFWLLLAGGVAIILGLAIQGQNVITTIGEDITPLQPSSGFCAELATAATVLLATSLGFPVSTSHALVGSLWGIRLMNRETSGGTEVLGKIVSAWALTVPIALVLGALSYWGLANLAELGWF
ncbi:MAG: inorganic phosphate transporter [Cyanobacteria bacterium P01_G01_bin.54]